MLLAVTVAVIAYLVVWMFTGNDDGLDPEEPDGRAVPLPGSRPLVESDISALRFDTVVRGYRMVQVDAALRRAAYDVGYKQELIDVLEAEVIALRDGRLDDAEALRQARDGAVGGTGTSVAIVPSLSVSEDGTDTAAVESVTDDETGIDQESHGVDPAHLEAAGDSAVESGDPVAAGAEVAEPIVARPEVAEPVVARPEVAEPEVAEPATGQRKDARNRSDREDETLGDRAATGR